MQDFTATARLMSSPTLLDIAAQSIRPCSAARWRAAIAKAELRERIRRGDVDDMDHARADALGLIE